jgi:hypothetical protein
VRLPKRKSNTLWGMNRTERIYKIELLIRSRGSVACWTSWA